MARLLTHLLADERGSSAIDYALIAGILGVSLIIGLTSLRDALSVFFGTIMNRF